MNLIIKRAKELYKIETYYLKILKSKPPKNLDEILSIIWEGSSIEEDLKRLLVEYDPTTLNIENKEIKKIIKSVIEGKGLKCIEAYGIITKELLPIISKSANKTKTDDPDFFKDNWDFLFETFHNQFDLSSYLQKKFILGPIITKSSVPPELKNIFFELKEAYASGLDKTCIALCRMIIDVSFSDVLKRNSKYKNSLELIKSAKNNIKFEFGLFENINITKSLNLIADKDATKSHKIRKAGNDAVHSNRGETINTIEIIKNTINIVETLYDNIKK